MLLTEDYYPTWSIFSQG